MIQPDEPKDCCGCGACYCVCPKCCIDMKVDTEGFAYPVVDTASCIDCGLCEKVCPFAAPCAPRKPSSCYAAISDDEPIRMQSSSGGLFTHIAEKVIEQGGVVFGARFDREWQVVIDYTETKEGLAAFRGSKYVQSITGTTYREVRDFLKQGRKVLYSGTPCQVSGLRHFLQKDYENLLTVDFACHGVPSPKVWGMYLDEVTGAARHAITDITFRSKRNGWKNYEFEMTYKEDDKIVEISFMHSTNPYMRAFISDMILRPSCHDCKSKSGRSHSDITIGDFWGVGSSHPEMDDDKGTGLLLVNSEKGRRAIDFTSLTVAPASIEEMVPYNGGLVGSSKPHRHRARFFKKLEFTPPPSFGYRVN